MPGYSSSSLAKMAAFLSNNHLVATLESETSWKGLGHYFKCTGS